MIQPKLIRFDSKGAETSRKLDEDEIVEIHYDQYGETHPVFNVELTDNGFGRGGPLVRVNLNDGVALTFDNPAELKELLGYIEDALNTEVERTPWARARVRASLGIRW